MQEDVLLAPPMGDRDREVDLSVVPSSAAHALLAGGETRVPLSLRVSYDCSYGLVSRHCATGERASTDSDAVALSRRVADALDPQASWTCTGFVCRTSVECRVAVCGIFPQRCAGDSQHVPSAPSGTLSIVVDHARTTQITSIDIEC